MDKHNEQLLRKLPSVDVLLKNPELESLLANVGRKVVVESIRKSIDELRELIISQKESKLDESTIHQKIISAAMLRIKAVMSPYYRRVINATGIILHTGLGRAVLAGQALKQIQD